MIKFKNAILIILLIIGTTMLTRFVVGREYNNQLQKQNLELESMNKEIEVLENKVMQLENELHLKSNSTSNIINEVSKEDFKILGINDYNIIIKDLHTHPELIHFEGVLGGKMQFTHVYILNDKWVYAKFSDGHIQGYGLYEFSIDDKLNISWKVIKEALN